MTAREHPEPGPWVRGPKSQAAGDPPHFTGTDPRHPNELGVIWADDAHTEAVAIEDWDGCSAKVLRTTEHPEHQEERG